MHILLNNKQIYELARIPVRKYHKFSNLNKNYMFICSSSHFLRFKVLSSRFALYESCVRGCVFCLPLSCWRGAICPWQSMLAVRSKISPRPLVLHTALFLWISVLNFLHLVRTSVKVEFTYKFILVWLPV